MTASQIDEQLLRLPSHYLVARRDDARLVVGPAGVFVVCGDFGGLEEASEGAFELARVTRVSLADTVLPTPVVESVVVSRARQSTPGESLVVFLYLLIDLVSTGSQIDPRTVCEVRTLLLEGSLVPGWELQQPLVQAA
ncbi:MAG: hypothetical protein V3V01_02275 [Acidimicrobiales bacterium]